MGLKIKIGSLGVISKTLFVWLSGLMAFLPSIALAHGGGLNADGCHTNKKTGEYHCHRGGSGGSNSGGGGSSIYIAPAASPPPKKQRSKVPEASGPVALISVGDGDTIRVRTAAGQPVTIRLACIDAPETAQGDSGAAATGYLRMLLGGGWTRDHSADY